MKLGNVEIKNNVFLAPMAGITDMAFRRICKEYGAGLTCTEMVSAKGLYYNDEKTKLLTAIHEDEFPIAVQIFGADSMIMAEVAKKISTQGVPANVKISEKENSSSNFTSNIVDEISEKNLIPNLIDINMGCPAPKVVKNEDGSKLMLHPELIDEITREVVKASEVPVTIKIRKGWDEDHINAVEIAQIAEKNGVSAIAVHGRTRQEFYSGKADLDIIKKVKENVKIPVIGNGDIMDCDSARKMFEYTGCDAIMIGRGALGNPWIFRNILKGIDEKPSNAEVYDVIRKHYELLSELKGEYVAVREMRKHLAAYIKGMLGAAEIRKNINTMESKVEVLEMLKKIYL